MLCLPPWTFCHQTPTWLTPLLDSVCAQASHQRDLPWLSIPAPRHSLVPYLALFFSLHLPVPKFKCFCMYVHIFLLEGKLHDNRSLSMFWSLLSVLCLVLGVWSVFVQRMWFHRTSPFCLLNPVLHTSGRGLPTVHQSWVMTPPEILGIFQDPFQIPPFL